MKKNNEFGFFSKNGKEYNVTTLLTPKPWLNYISNRKYGLVTSQNGSGFSFYLSVLLQRLTYYSHDSYVPNFPQTGKYIFFRDMESKKYWTLAPLFDIDEEKYDSFFCKHGLGYSEIHSLINGIESSFRIFVPIENDNPVEIWTIRVINKSDRKRNLQLFPYLQWQLNGYNPTTTFTDKSSYTQANYLDSKSTILVSMSDVESVIQYSTFMSTDYVPDTFDISLQKFFGSAGNLHDPMAVRLGKCSNSVSCCDSLVGVMEKDFSLDPEETKEFNIVVGVADDKADIDNFRDAYFKQGKIEDSFQHIAEYYQQKITSMQIKTKDAEFDRYCNIWLKNNVLHSLKWTRGLDRGYRDVLQDVMGACPLWPKESRKRILDAFRHQHFDGTAPRQWSDISDQHDMRLYMDSTIWMAWTIEEYLVNTGDFSLLDEKVPFLDTDKAKSVMEHLLKGTRILYARRGIDGLCLIGEGDWNDSLNETGVRNKGQGVWLSCAAFSAFEKVQKLAEFLGKNKIADEMAAKAAELKTIINKVGWNGDWYIYAINDDGVHVGDKNEIDGNIHLNAQTWSLFLKIADGKKVKKLFDIVDNVLDTEVGNRLVYPAYKKYRPGIGRITGIVPGFFENGSIYTHTVAMKILADCVHNRGDQAMESFLKITSLNPNISVKHTGLEPYSFTNFFIGPENKTRFGQAPYSWFSGSAAWLHMLLYNRIIGFQPTYQGILIQPCIPETWEKVKMERWLRNAYYVVNIQNEPDSMNTISRIEVDGHEVLKNSIPFFNDGKTHTVNIWLSSKTDGLCISPESKLSLHSKVTDTSADSH